MLLPPTLIPGAARGRGHARPSTRPASYDRMRGRERARERASGTGAVVGLVPLSSTLAPRHCRAAYVHRRWIDRMSFDTHITLCIPFVDGVQQSKHFLNRQNVVFNAGLSINLAVRSQQCCQLLLSPEQLFSLRAAAHTSVPQQILVPLVPSLARTHTVRLIAGGPRRLSASMTSTARRHSSPGAGARRAGA